jgi:hypothetical protein
MHFKVFLSKFPAFILTQPQVFKLLLTQVSVFGLTGFDEDIQMQQEDYY